jgi:hypothetical protein
VSAVISECGRFRYVLTRPALHDTIVERGSAVFLMLNPSTADAEHDDPTIRRCRGFAKKWGCNGIIVVNLYAYRATDPADLHRAGYPIGPENDAWLSNVARENGDVLCAWGTKAQGGRVDDVCRMLRAAGARLSHLGLTKEGHPRHPLYLPGELMPQVWT